MGSFKRSSSPFNISAEAGNFTSCVQRFWLNGSAELTVILDDLPPELDIISPANNTITNRTAIAVAGRCEPGSVLRVNDRLVPLEQDGAWSALVELPSEGANGIIVEAQDAMLNTARRSMTIVRDTVMPAVQLYGPADGFLVNTTTINVSGIMSEPGANLTVNGRSVAVGADGRFIVVLELTEGRNTIEVRATDEAGNTAVILRRGIFDTVLPFVRVVEPAGGTATNASHISVIGLVEEDARLMVGGLILPVDGTSFEVLLELNEGENVFVFTARDMAGNVNTTVLNVMRDSVPPAINITSPLSGAKLNRSTVEVAGSTEPDAHVRVDGKAVSMTGGAFWVELTLKEGANSIVIEAQDGLGNLEREVLSVWVDTAGPRLSILGPANRTLSNQTVIEVFGITEPGASVWVAGRLTVGNADGRFSVLVSLPVEGQNIIQVLAWDGLFNTEYLNITVIRDTLACFNITSPADGARAGGGHVTVTGSAEPNSTIRMAGAIVPQAANGSFSMSVKLARGRNIIVVAVQDAAGNTKTVELTVTGTFGAGGPAGPDMTVLLGAAVLVLACAGIAAVLYRRRRA